MTATLPPLPVPAIEASQEFADLGGTFGALYTADQMRAFVAEAVAAEREACARLCESLTGGVWIDAAQTCADAIRDIKDRP